MRQVLFSIVMFSLLMVAPDTAMSGLDGGAYIRVHNTGDIRVGVAVIVNQGKGLSGGGDFWYSKGWVNIGPGENVEVVNGLYYWKYYLAFRQLDQSGNEGIVRYQVPRDASFSETTNQLFCVKNPGPFSHKVIVNNIEELRNNCPPGYQLASFSILNHSFPPHCNTEYTLTIHAKTAPVIPLKIIKVIGEPLHSEKRVKVDRVFGGGWGYGPHVRSQFQELVAQGQEVLVCSYPYVRKRTSPPAPPGSGFTVYKFWYEKVPYTRRQLRATSLRYRGQGHPFLEIPEVAITSCPPDLESARALRRKHLNLKGR